MDINNAIVNTQIKVNLSPVDINGIVIPAINPVLWVSTDDTVVTVTPIDRLVAGDNEAAILAFVSVGSAVVSASYEAAALNINVSVVAAPYTVNFIPVAEPATTLPAHYITTIDNATKITNTGTNLDGTHFNLDNLIIWIRVDGVGTGIPTPDSTNILVDVLTSYTAAGIARSIASEILCAHILSKIYISGTYADVNTTFVYT